MVGTSFINIYRLFFIYRVMFQFPSLNNSTAKKCKTFYYPKVIEKNDGLDIINIHCIVSEHSVILEFPSLYN